MRPPDVARSSGTVVDMIALYLLVWLAFTCGAIVLAGFVTVTAFRRRTSRQVRGGPDASASTSGSTRHRLVPMLMIASAAALSYAGIMWFGFPPEDGSLALATVLPPLFFAALALISTATLPREPS